MAGVILILTISPKEGCEKSSHQRFLLRQFHTSPFIPDSMLLDSAVIAALIYIFARYNAEGGLLRSFLMLLGVIVLTVAIMLALPGPLLVLVLPIYLMLLAVGLTVVCGTQPAQTGKIIGCFLLFRAGMWGIGALIRSTL